MIISNVIAAIQNAILKKHESIEVQYTSNLLHFVTLLEKHGFIKSWRLDYSSKVKRLIIFFRYSNEGLSAINSIKKFNPKIRRFNVKNKSLRSFASDLSLQPGMWVLSTPSSSVLSSSSEIFIKENKGGRLIFYVV